MQHVVLSCQMPHFCFYSVACIKSTAMDKEWLIHAIKMMNYPQSTYLFQNLNKLVSGWREVTRKLDISGKNCVGSSTELACLTTSGG